MIPVGVKIKGIEYLKAEVDDLVKDRIPKMTAMAIAETTWGLRKAAIEQWLPQVFDRPTRWTLGGIKIAPSGWKAVLDNNLSASFGFKDDSSVSKGTPSAWYLNPQAEGGTRGMKRYERALQRAGILPQDMYAMPGEAARMDASGNMDRGQIVQILSYFRAFPEMGYRANITDKRRKGLARGTRKTNYAGAVFFVGRPDGGNLPLGIYQRLSWGGKGARKGALKPIVIFTPRTPGYAKRFPFYDWAQDYVDRKFTEIFARIADETREFHKKA